VIEDIFEKPDEFPLPDCAPERDCQDCGLWDYFDDRDPELPTDPSKFL
jgi:lipase ATG15